MFKDHLVGEEQMADYLLYWMNQNDEYGYVPALGLKAPSDNIKEVLFHIALQRNLRLRVRTTDGKLGYHIFMISVHSCLFRTGAYREYPDTKSSAQIFLSHFRRTAFGRILLDKDLINAKPT